MHGGKLYVSDPYTRRVNALAVEGKAETFARTSGLPCGYWVPGFCLRVVLRPKYQMKPKNSVMAMINLG